LQCFALHFLWHAASSLLPTRFPKQLSVSGSAEMEIIPDEIYVNVVLREYQKKGENKKELETLKNDFLTACRSAGIADSAISIVSLYRVQQLFLVT
jgi:uncharacterized protein YggE